MNVAGGLMNCVPPAILLRTSFAIIVYKLKSFSL